MTNQPGSNPTRRSLAVVLTLAGLFAFFGAAGVLVPMLISSERLTGVGADASDRLARSRIDPEELSSILGRIRILGAGYLAAGVAALALRRLLARALDAVVRSAAEDLTALRRGMIAGVRSGAGLEALVVTALGAALRIRFLNDPMRTDETYTYFSYIKKGPIYILLKYSTGDHVLHHLLAWVSNALFGPNPVAQRLCCFLAGCLLVLLTYVAVRAIWDRMTALLASALVATSPYLVFLSVNARGYSLMLCFYAGCLALCPHLRRTNSPAGWAAFAVLAVLGLFSIPVMVYPLIATAGWILTIAFVTRTGVPPLDFLRHAIAAAGLTAFLFVLVYTPGMIGSGLTWVVSNEMTVGMTRGEWVERLPHWLAYVWAHGAVPLPIWTVPGVVALVLIEIFFDSRRVLSPSPMLVALLIIPVVLFVQRLHPMPRVCGFAFLLMIFSVSAGATRLIAAVLSVPRARAYATLALAAAAVAGLVVANFRGASDLAETGTCRDARSMAEFLRTAPPEDHIYLTSMNATIFVYYCLLDGFPAARLESDPAIDGPRWLFPAPRQESDPAREGSNWLIVGEDDTFEIAARSAVVPPEIVSRLREIKRFPRGGRIFGTSVSPDS